MLGYFRALAADYDGTLSRHGRPPEPAILQALTRIRADGGVVLIVTGRILSELRADFPDVEAYADMIVCENGCTLWSPLGVRLLNDPVDPRLAEVLAQRGAQTRSGQVILAGSASDRTTALEQLRSMELDCQLVFNRAEMMILPSGVTKGTGLFDALGDLGVSSHSTVGIGDAQNDLALLNTCEVGIAAGGAVGSLASTADVALPDSDTNTLVRMLDSLFTSGQVPQHSWRRQLRLGVTADQDTTSVPSSQLNLLICGASGSGKSYAAGLCAEGLIALGYSVLVIDPEGDHQGLGSLRGVVLIHASDGLPSPERVVARFSERFMSVVLDLSTVPSEERQRYLRRLTTAMERSRLSCGLPHWIIDDEAQANLLETSAGSSFVERDTAEGRWGFCLASYQPERLDTSTLLAMDAVLLVGQPSSVEPDLLATMARIAGTDTDAMAAQLAALGPGQTYLAQHRDQGPSGPFHLATRVTEHHRHWHKYTDDPLPPDRRFYFRDKHDRVVAVAGNLRELTDILRNTPEDVIDHHVRRGELSAWLRGVFADTETADEVGDIEQRLVQGSLSAGSGREELLAVLLHEYRV